MLHSLQLGHKTFPTNLIQGPLAGVSSSPFRQLIWQYSQPAYCCTEMISCKTILHQWSYAKERFMHKDTHEGPLCFQLSSHDPQELAEATKRVTDANADLIDLNCGCPVKKIRAKGAGSKLLTNTKKLYDLISAMKNNTHLPVSIKIRVEGVSDEKTNRDVATVVNDAGADFLVVHGRHWTEHYETPCRYDHIAYFAQTLKIPVIGNGDVACLASLKKMLATGCAGVMIGRASVGQPWLIQQLQAAWNQETFVRPTLPEIGQILLTHVEKLIALLGNEQFAIYAARTLAKYYARPLKNRSAFCEAINRTTHFNDYAHLCMRYFVEQNV